MSHKRFAGRMGHAACGSEFGHPCSKVMEGGGRKGERENERKKKERRKEEKERKKKININ